MAEPISTERLEHIRAQLATDGCDHCAYDLVAEELVAEIDRLRKIEAELADMRRRLGRPREEWGYEFPEHHTGVSFAYTEDGARELAARTMAATGGRVGEMRIMHRYVATGPWRPVDEEGAGDG